MIMGYYFLMKKKIKSTVKQSKKRRTKKEIEAEIPPISLFVRNRREELGYTQEELAFRVGISSGFLKAFERGKKTVRLDKVIDLLDYLGARLEVKSRGANV